MKFLVRICSDLGLKEAQEYATKLKKAEKAKELKEQVSLRKLILMDKIFHQCRQQSDIHKYKEILDLYIVFMHTPPPPPASFTYERLYVCPTLGFAP